MINRSERKPLAVDAQPDQSAAVHVAHPGGRAWTVRRDTVYHPYHQRLKLKMNNPPTRKPRDATDARELWTTLADAVGYAPLADTAEWKGWRTVIQQWADSGLTPLDVKRAVRGYTLSHPTKPVTPWAINESPQAYIALVTPRQIERTADPTGTYGVIEPTGDEVGPPVDVLEQLGLRRVGGDDET